MNQIDESDQEYAEVDVNLAVILATIISAAILVVIVLPLLRIQLLLARREGNGHSRCYGREARIAPLKAISQPAQVSRRMALR